MSYAEAMLVALVLDALIGWPDALTRRIGHPVIWMGYLISACDKGWNLGSRPARLRMGAVSVIVVCGTSAAPALAVQALLPDGVFASLVLGILAWPLVASRSLYAHVSAVQKPLAAGDLDGARHAVSMIVGRNPKRLDASGIARAATESLAENASDGVVAPLFWGAIGGLPGIVLYKAINTMDSMIGHRTERYEAFGKAAARLDDLVNLLPARLTAWIFGLAAGSRARAAFAIMWRDARSHRSPNAGWPEAAVAGAIGRRLSGPRAYEGGLRDEPWLNSTAPDPDAIDMVRALALYLRAMALLALVLLGLALI